MLQAGKVPIPPQVSVTPFASPVLITATAGNAQVVLSWGKVTGATNYSVEYGARVRGLWSACQCWECDKLHS